MRASDKWFDTDAEMQKLRDASPNPSKVPQAEDKMRYFSHFRGEEGENLQSSTSSWLCARYNQPVTITAVERSLDGERVLTFWSCEPCQSVGVTPYSVKKPPEEFILKVV